MSVRREREIVRYLSQAGDKGATIREIHEAVTAAIGDEVSRPAYYKVLERMEAAGLVESTPDEQQADRSYRAAPTLSYANAITLDDVYEMLPFVQTTEAIARAIEAQEYYERNRDTTIRRAAQALLEENPVQLFHDMIVDASEKLRAQQRIVLDSELSDAAMRHRLQSEYFELENLVYRALSLTDQSVKLPPYLLFEQRDDAQPSWDSDTLYAELRGRVFGDRFIREIDVSGTRGSLERSVMNVSGSDGSMHAGSLSIRTARGYVEDEANIVTFNNAIAFLRLSSLLGAQGQRDGLVYSAPMTRQTLDDPSYKGMVLVSFMHPELSEAEYEHMTRCATDVVQLRVDEMVFSGGARDLATGQLLPTPMVHVRDGTVTPQERYFNHYHRPDSYGEMVREGIGLQRKILSRILMSPKPPVFAGAVKSTRMRLFSSVLNWYIARGSKRKFGQPIDPTWDLSRAAHILDNQAMTALLASLPNQGRDGKFFVTCAVLRQFHSLTEFYRSPGHGDWLRFFEDEKQDALKRHQRLGGGYPLPYHATIDLHDDAFVFMCRTADYVSFYIGHTGGDPPPILPRYEFLDSLRAPLDSGDFDRAARQVERSVHLIVQALDATGVATDLDHNFLSRTTLVKIIPAVVMRAHEYAKTLGKKLETELRSVVISRLITARKWRTAPDVDIHPVAVRRYLERFARARAALPRLDAADNEDLR